MDNVWANVEALRASRGLTTTEMAKLAGFNMTAPEKVDGFDEKSISVIENELFQVVFRNDEDGNEDEIEVKTGTLSLKASPLANGYVKARTGDDTTEDVYTNWYKSVYLSEAAAQGEG